MEQATTAWAYFVSTPTASKLSPSGGEKLLRLLSREVDAGGAPPNMPTMNSVAAFFAQASQQEQNPLANLGMAGETTFGILVFNLLKLVFINIKKYYYLGFVFTWNPLLIFYHTRHVSIFGLLWFHPNDLGYFKNNLLLGPFRAHYLWYIFIQLSTLPWCDHKKEEVSMFYSPSLSRKSLTFGKKR